MKSKHEIPGKYDFMKTHSKDFILNERYGSRPPVDVQCIDKIYEQDGQVSGIKGSESSNKLEPLISSVILNMDENNRAYHDTSVTTGLSIISNTHIDYTGYAPKKYVTECYLKPKSIPFWYSESVILQTNSTKRKYEEKIYFANKLHPFKWSEMMTTKMSVQPKNIVTECEIYVGEANESKEHYISLEPQQMAIASS